MNSIFIGLLEILKQKKESGPTSQNKNLLQESGMHPFYTRKIWYYTICQFYLFAYPYENFFLHPCQLVMTLFMLNMLACLLPTFCKKKQLYLIHPHQLNFMGFPEFTVAFIGAVVPYARTCGRKLFLERIQTSFFFSLHSHRQHRGQENPAGKEPVSRQNQALHD